MLSFFSFKLHTFTHKVNGSSAYYKVVFLVLLFISWSVVSCPPRIYLSCYLWCLALWQALSRRRPQSGPRRLQSGRQWIIASSYCSCLATRHSSTLLSASLFSAILNRRGGWLPILAGFTFGAIAEPLLGAMVGAIAFAGCDARVPLAGCHAMRAIAGRHCGGNGWMPLLGAIAGC